MDIPFPNEAIFMLPQRAGEMIKQRWDFRIGHNIVASVPV